TGAGGDVDPARTGEDGRFLSSPTQGIDGVPPDGPGPSHHCDLHGAPPRLPSQANGAGWSRSPIRESVESEVPAAVSRSAASVRCGTPGRRTAPDEGASQVSVGPVGVIRKARRWNRRDERIRPQRAALLEEGLHALLGHVQRVPLSDHDVRRAGREGEDFHGALPDGPWRNGRRGGDQGAAACGSQGDEGRELLAHATRSTPSRRPRIRPPSETTWCANSPPAVSRPDASNATGW